MKILKDNSRKNRIINQLRLENTHLLNKNSILSNDIAQCCRLNEQMIHELEITNKSRKKIKESYECVLSELSDLKEKHVNLLASFKILENEKM